MDSFTKELLEKYRNYDKNKDFVVADGPEKQEVIGIIESLFTQMGDHTSNVFKIKRGALLCFPWALLKIEPPKDGEKWAVSFRGKDESFLLSYNDLGVLRGHLYSKKATVYQTITEFKDARVLSETEMPDLSFPVLVAETK